jgi:hypothetical protein
MEPRIRDFTKYDIPIVIWPGILIVIFAIIGKM